MPANKPKPDPVEIDDSFKAAMKQRSPLLDTFKEYEITDDYLIGIKLKSELESIEPKFLKVKGAISKKDLPKGYTIVATSGTLTYDKEGEQLFGDGETIIRCDLADMRIRQDARKDAHKLKGDYAPQVIEVPGLTSIADRLQNALDKKANHDTGTD
jgi:hypothetical protein